MDNLENDLNELNIEIMNWKSKSVKQKSVLRIMLNR